MNGSRPSEARDRVLAQLRPEKQLEIMQRAEKRGPLPDDPDWLLVETMMDCAARIEKAVPITEKTLEVFTERFERVEQGVDDLKAQNQKTVPSASASAIVDPKVYAQLDRIESRSRPQVVASVNRVARREVIVFAISAIIVAIVSWYGDHYAPAHGLSILVTVLAFVAGAGAATVLYELRNR